MIIPGLWNTHTHTHTHAHTDNFSQFTNVSHNYDRNSLNIHSNLNCLVCLFSHSFASPFISLFVCVSVCLSVGLSIGPSIHPSIHPSVRSFDSLRDRYSIWIYGIQLLINMTISITLHSTDGSATVNITRGVGVYGELMVSWILMPEDHLAFVQVKGQVILHDLQENASIILKVNSVFSLCLQMVFHFKFFISY